MENALSFASSPLPPLSPRPFRPRFPDKLRLLMLNRSKSVHGISKMFARHAFGSDEMGRSMVFRAWPTKFSWKRYELGQADLTVASFHELSVINLRRLFAHIGSTFMDLQKQVIEKAPSKRELHIDTIF